jgi:ELWxxDGT repeat protein
VHCGVGASFFTGKKIIIHECSFGLMTQLKAMLVCLFMLSSLLAGCGHEIIDSDGDGVVDGFDDCPDTLAGLTVDASGCSDSQLDDDNDGVMNDLDDCPGSDINLTIDANGCEESQLDDDGDGVPNSLDLCDDTEAGTTVDSNGCSDDQLDDDGDGVPNGLDLCDDTDAGATVDSNGCSDDQLDDDGDGVPNGLDLCDDTDAGAAVDGDGCSDNQLDDDGDGVTNDLDDCPGTEPGETVDTNGCSNGQLDDDGDGVPNVADDCPDSDPGAVVDGHGCADNQLDYDGDGVTNDIDDCPNTAPGSTVDANGCSDGQLDDDGDGVPNSDDLCPGTPTGALVNSDGCSTFPVLNGSRNNTILGEIGDKSYFLNVDVNDQWSLYTYTNANGFTEVYTETESGALFWGHTMFVHGTGSHIYFTVIDYSSNTEDLWVTDGTAAGTVFLQEFDQARAHVVDMGGSIYFLADDGANGFELWSSDGTDTGTSMVLDIQPGIADGVVAYAGLIEKGGNVFFTGDDGTNGAELWSSDGTAAGTSMVVDIVSGSGSSTPASFAIISGKIYFKTVNGIMRTDGTAGGLQGPISTLNVVSPLWVANGHLFYVAYTGGDFELYSFSGMVETMLFDYGTTTTPMVNVFHHIIGACIYVIGNELYFCKNDDTTNTAELWKSDGTVSGTQMIEDFTLSTTIYYMQAFYIVEELNGKSYFLGQDASGMPAIWITAGTASTTSVAHTFSGLAILYDLHTAPTVGFVKYWFDPVNGWTHSISPFTY